MKGLKVRMIGERGYSRSNKWILGNLGNTLMEAKTNPEYLGNTLMEAKGLQNVQDSDNEGRKKHRFYIVMYP